MVKLAYFEVRNLFPFSICSLTDIMRYWSTEVVTSYASMKNKWQWEKVKAGVSNIRKQF